MFHISDYFDVKKFLSFPLNGGGAFFSEDDFGRGCGCLKGAFAHALGVNDSSWCFNVLTRKYSLNDLCGLFEYPGQEYEKELPAIFDRHLLRQDPLLLAILDRAEEILIIRQKPQYAKLFTLRALRKFGYIPRNTEVPEPAALDKVAVCTV